MTFQDKVEGAHELVQAVLKVARRPAIMSSFGKDSMVVLHIVRQHLSDVPVIFHREPFLPRKYAFANRVISEWDLTVYDFPPIQTAVQEKDGCVEIMNYYPGGNQPVALPTGICEPQEGERIICGLHELYLKPTGTFTYPWDYVFHGHKSSDVDPIYGHVPLASDVANNIGSVSAAFPIRHFTDEDVWTYHDTYELPLHVERYEPATNGRREKADKRDNPDYFPACTACMKKGGGAVACPRLGGRLVSNVANQLRWAPREQLSYLESKPKA